MAAAGGGKGRRDCRNVTITAVAPAPFSMEAANRSLLLPDRGQIELLFLFHFL